MKNQSEIDLEFRPKTYFRPDRLEKYLLSKVKSAILRKSLKDLFDKGEHDAIFNLASDTKFSDADRKMLESVHPMFMGGNYLPDTENGEVEIARISIRSTTFDVTCVYAKPVEGLIHYRVVDEYGGETLRHKTETTTSLPMTLGEFSDFFLAAWPLIDVLKMNYEDDVDGALSFFSADSDYYPELDDLCRLLVRDHFPNQDSGDKCPFCGYFNSPPSAELCEHAAAWVWDGQIEALGCGETFASALEKLAQIIEDAEKDSPIKAMLDAQANRSIARKNIIDSAIVPFEQALDSVTQIQSGNGWTTNGMLGGSGNTLYGQDPHELQRLTLETQAILKACNFRILVAENTRQSLEMMRPDSATKWQLVASGFWSEDVYHSGHVAYYIANLKPGSWIMEECRRNTILDDVTDEDVEEGRLNDDQIQAMWGQTLDEAKNAEYRSVVALAEDVDPDCTASEIATVLYGEVCRKGGYQITEPDAVEGLIKF